VEKRAFEMRLEGLAAVQRARAISQPDDDELQRGTASGGGGGGGTSRRSQVQSGSKVAYSDQDPPSPYAPCLSSIPRLRQPLAMRSWRRDPRGSLPGVGQPAQIEWCD